jgi:hypothetical protein
VLLQSLSYNNSEEYGTVMAPRLYAILIKSYKSLVAEFEELLTCQHLNCIPSFNFMRPVVIRMLMFYTSDYCEADKCTYV